MEQHKIKEKLLEYKIGVLAGGHSPERDISLKSGEAVLGALKSAGFNAVVIDAKRETLAEVIRSHGIGLAFIALHGDFGEDGEVQQILGSVGIPYTGSGPRASRLAIDKIDSKKAFDKAGIKVPQGVEVVSFQEDPPGLVFGPPWIVKPRKGGSSMGVSVAGDKESLIRAVEEALSYGNGAMIEEFIPGREITVGVLCGQTLPAIEIFPASGSYDLEAKYFSDSTFYEVPARLTPEENIRIMEAGSKAHEILGCSGFSRTDIRLTAGGEAYVLELNTVPGLTEKSLLPMAARSAGLDFEALCVKMLACVIEDQVECKPCEGSRHSISGGEM